jgi:hypothetical protein
MKGRNQANGLPADVQAEVSAAHSGPTGWAPIRSVAVAGAGARGCRHDPAPLSKAHALFGAKKMTAMSQKPKTQKLQSFASFLEAMSSQPQIHGGSGIHSQGCIRWG